MTAPLLLRGGRIVDPACGRDGVADLLLADRVVAGVGERISREGAEVVDASGLEVDATLGDEWPQFRHASRAEFLQTLPHVHGTSGFFVARLTVR